MNDNNFKKYLLDSLSNDNVSLFDFIDLINIEAFNDKVYKDLDIKYVEYTEGDKVIDLLYDRNYGKIYAKDLIGFQDAIINGKFNLDDDLIIYKYNYGTTNEYYTMNYEDFYSEVVKEFKDYLQNNFDEIIIDEDYVKNDYLFDDYFENKEQDCSLFA